MRLAQLLMMHKPFLDLVAKYGLNTKSIRYINIYYDYKRMRHKEGLKYDYVIKVLAESNHISVSKAKRLLKIFNINIDDDAE